MDTSTPTRLLRCFQKKYQTMPSDPRDDDQHQRAGREALEALGRVGHEEEVVGQDAQVDQVDDGAPIVPPGCRGTSRSCTATTSQMPLARFTYGKIRAAMAVTPNTEKISMAGDREALHRLVLPEDVEGDHDLAEDEAQDVVLDRRAKRGLMSVNHFGPMRSMPQAKMMRGKARYDSATHHRSNARNESTEMKSSDLVLVDHAPAGRGSGSTRARCRRPRGRSPALSTYCVADEEVERHHVVQGERRPRS